MEWLEKAVREAADRAEKEKRISGGNVADEATHTLLRLLIDVLRRYSNRFVRKPYFNPKTERWRNNFVLRFLLACLRPIGADYERIAVSMALNRAGVEWFIEKKTLKRRSPKRTKK